VRILRTAAAALAGGLALAGMAGPAFADYYVYCASGRVEVDSRDPEQMRIARGAVCQFGQFSTRSAAEDFARNNFGGIGASCSCR
jgi:hypothetical protein